MNLQVKSTNTSQLIRLNSLKSLKSNALFYYQYSQEFPKYKSNLRRDCRYVFDIGLSSGSPRHIIGHLLAATPPE